MRHRLLVVLIAILAPLAIPSPASAAAPTYHDTFRDVFYAPSEGEDPLVCKEGDVVLGTFSEASTFHANDLVKPVPGTDQAFFGHFNYSFRARHVNLSTEESFTVLVDGVFREVSAELIDAEAPFDGLTPPKDEEGNDIPIVGPVYRFVAIEVARFTVRDDKNRLVYNERGRILWDAVFDTRGDGEPGGILIEEEEPLILSGAFPFRDFCDLALELTT